MQCDPELRRQISDRLADFATAEQPSHELGDDEVRAAAVALIVVEQGHGADIAGLPSTQEWRNDAALLLTRRSSKLRRHAGQWALPGGRIDTGETARQAAVREAHEEIGLPLSTDAELGRLDDFVTRSGFVITPIVYWAGRAANLVPDPNEVASIHRIPLTELLRADAPLLDYHELDAQERLSEHNHPVLRMPVGDSWIAAPTAALLYQFREVCLLGKPTRVAHFEQPKFTWR